MRKENRTEWSGNASCLRVLLALWILLLGGNAMAAGTKTLRGHVPAATAHLSAIGNLGSTNRLHLAVGLPLHHAAELEALLGRLCDPASPDYHHYLTPGQFTEAYGPTPEDYEAVKAFARQNHLIVNATHGNRLLLDVEGSVADVQGAFHITLKSYHHPTEARDFYAPDVEPSVDANLPVADISGLSDYGLPKPKFRTVDSAAGNASLIPRAGTGSGTGGTYLGHDFRAAYLPGVSLTGAGQTLGLLEFDGYYTADITTYESLAGQTAVPLQTVLLDNYSGKPTSKGNTEVSLDIEMAVAMAPGLARIVVFEAGPSGLQNDVLNAMVASNNISQLSCSWGWDGGPSTTTDNIFRQMQAQGQSFFNASGDSDAFTLGAFSVDGVDNTSVGNAPSSSPYITQVGGTTLTTTGPGGTWSSETVWNWGLDQGVYVGSSGGISSYYGIPAWQAGINMSANGGSSTYRNLPDVALTGDNIYVTYGNGKHTTLGGTSCATPLWAGLTALMNQQSVAASRGTVGFINPAIYALAKSSAYGTTFHDITTGNNFWPSSPAAYSAVAGYDLCTGWGTPLGQSLIDAVAGVGEPLMFSPAVGFTATGFNGGPFNTNSETFVLTNTGNGTLQWSITNVPAWLALSPANGTLTNHASVQVIANLNSTSTTLPPGTYANSIYLNDLTSGASQSRPFVLQINQGWQVLPLTGFISSGMVGGPFSVAVTNFVITNLEPATLNWTMGPHEAWLNITTTSGSVPSHSSMAVTVSLNAVAVSLATGAYTNTLTINNVAGGTAQSRQIVLQVGQSIVQNGGFETGDFTGWTLVGDGVTGSSTYDAVESVNTSYSAVVHSGNYGVFFGDVQLATLSQSLDTVPGQGYLLSFWLDNPASGTGQQFLANWITNTAGTSQVYYVTNPPVMGWTNMTFVVTATTSNTVLQFGVENVPNFFGFDDVSVTPIPQPTVTSLTHLGNSVGLTWYTVPGVNYQVLYSTNLTQTNWTVLTSSVASSNKLTFTDTPGSDVRRFYRIRHLP